MPPRQVETEAVLQAESPLPATEVQLHRPDGLQSHCARWAAYICACGQGASLSRHPGWLRVLQQGLQHLPYCLEVVSHGRTKGLLGLCYVRSLLFGRYLVSLPYLNLGGVVANDRAAARTLIDHAVRLADELNVRYLELRHERPLDHPALTHARTDKVHMRLELPTTASQLWRQFSPKVRNQVRKGEKHALTVHWGSRELLPEFYSVFSRNMRDLGTPVYGEALFRSTLETFPDGAELCVVRSGSRPWAAALLIHGPNVTEVASASSLRPYNYTNANMLMYWHLLQRAVGRGQQLFDFGRSTTGSSTHQFKKQWGAVAAPACWQYYVRTKSPGELLPDHPRYQRQVRLWRRLPVPLTRWLGPAIVRGIP